MSLHDRELIYSYEYDHAALEDIRSMDGTQCAAVMDAARQLWAYPDYFRQPAPGYWEISTGGWSGNEDIIEAMQDNQVFWSLHWLESRRGGHYKFLAYA